MGDPAVPKGAFSAHVYCGQTDGWIKICHLIWYGGRPRPRPHCVRWGPSSPQKGKQQPQLFGSYLLRPNGRPSQLPLSSCTNGRPKIDCKNISFYYFQVCLCVSAFFEKRIQDDLPFTDVSSRLLDTPSCIRSNKHNVCCC